MSRELALAVRDEAAFVVEVGVETIDLSQSQLAKLPVKVTRRGDFKGEVTLEKVIPGQSGCGCAQTSGGSWPWLLLALCALRKR